MSADDREFLMNPDSWPAADMGNYCCLKRKDKSDIAFILTIDNPRVDGEIVISLGWVFDGGTGQVVTYESVDQLLEDGWYVD